MSVDQRAWGGARAVLLARDLPTVGDPQMTRILTGPLADLPRDLHDDLLAEVQELLRGVGPTASCLITGSLAEGLGNSRSDIDVYIVLPDEERPRGQSTSIGLRSERCVDCEYMALGGLAEIAHRVESATRHGTPLSRKELDRFYRTAISCRYVVHPSMVDVLDRFDKSLACSAAARQFGYEAAVDHARATLLLATGDARAGVLQLRRASVARASSLLAAQGEGYPATKWVFEKAARRWGSESEEFRDLLTAYGCVESTIPQVRSTLDAFTRAVTSEQGPRVLGRRWRLSAGVKVLETDTCVLVRGTSLARSNEPVAKEMCALLSSGLSWEAARAELARGLRVEEHIVQIGLQGAFEGLFAEGFVEPCEPGDTEVAR